MKIDGVVSKCNLVQMYENETEKSQLFQTYLTLSILIIISSYLSIIISYTYIII